MSPKQKKRLAKSKRETSLIHQKHPSGDQPPSMQMDEATLVRRIFAGFVMDEAKLMELIEEIVRSLRSRHLKRARQKQSISKGGKKHAVRRIRSH